MGRKGHKLPALERVGLLLVSALLLALAVIRMAINNWRPERVETAETSASAAMLDSASVVIIKAEDRKPRTATGKKPADTRGRKSRDKARDNDRPTEQRRGHDDIIAPA